MKLYTEDGRKLEVARKDGWTTIRETENNITSAYHISDSELVAMIDLINRLKNENIVLLAMPDDEQYRRFLGGNIGENSFLEEIKTDYDFTVCEFDSDQEAEEFFRPYRSEVA